MICPGDAGLVDMISNPITLIGPEAIALDAV